MKTITLIQAAALLVLAVVGAYAGSEDIKGGCPGSEPTAYCEL
ncbi:hypothetical protein [uncultured Pelagimonas sp.]|nr:hypothetical protein [uncultured Pelagimonas sp.]